MSTSLGRLAARAVLGCFLLNVAASGTVIEYETTDLVDLNPAEDLWQIDYFLSDRAFQQGEIFDVLFDPALYAALSVASAPIDWDPVILQQPDPGAPQPFDVGIYDTLALVDNASLADPFSVQFVFLGSGAPGVQPFEIFDVNFSLVESGRTTPRATPMPEPSEVTVLLLCLAFIATRRRGLQR